VELVKDHVDDGGLRALRRFHHGRLHDIQTVDGLWVAVEQLEQQVSPQCLHSFPPPPGISSPKFFGENFASLWRIFFAIARKKWAAAAFFAAPDAAARAGGAPRSDALPARPPRRSAVRSTDDESGYADVRAGQEARQAPRHADARALAREALGELRRPPEGAAERAALLRDQGEPPPRRAPPAPPGGQPLRRLLHRGDPDGPPGRH